MSRDIDWKVHELMGNDLTGWEWYEESGNTIFQHVSGSVANYDDIPHYSTTWEGAGLVMEYGALNNDSVLLKYSSVLKTWFGQFAGHHASADNGPLALCKAYISAMEERDNG